MRPLPCLILAFLFLAGCVPRNQYDAVNAELNYYRSEAAKVDSLENQAAISSYNASSGANLETQRLIRENESLRATNISLNESFKDLSRRYDEQVQKNIELTQTTGNQVTDLQQSLAQRKAEVTEQERLLREKEIQLYEREQELAAVSPEVYGRLDNRPATYGSTQPAGLDANQSSAVRQNQLQNELRQSLGNYAYNELRYSSPSTKELMLTIDYDLLFGGGDRLSEGGHNLVGQLASVLQRYRDAELRIIGHDGLTTDPVRALETSTDRAIAVTQGLVNRGIDSSSILAAGQGAYNPIRTDGGPAANRMNRRTEIVIVLP